uniref:Serine proteinase stubble n=1 Tax=Drosophila rhopaloa TaxID=1041015 RepID=A0A6P4FET7_DRORH
MDAQHTDTDTYTYTAARAVEATDLTPKKSRSSAIIPVKMPRPSLVFSLLTLGSLLLLLLLLPTTIDASPVFVDNPSLAQFQSGRNIRHLPCIVRKSGRSGVCMFAIDCIKQNGTHLGTCIDRFYFGSCCAMKEEAPLFAPEINDNSIDQNTISHFAHESTTLPTSALFKLTTESSLSSDSTHQHTTNELLKNVTQSYLSTAKPAPVRTTSNSSLITTRRPPLAHTTHKNSHFVVRTTLKSAVVPTTTTLTPTIKPPRRRTTTAKPVLTTAPIVVEQRIETTTVPTKFVTFQIVETTTPTVTDPTHLQETTTTTSTRRHTRPTGSSSVASRTTSKTTTTSPTTTTTTSTTTEARATTTTSTKAAVTTPRPTPPLRTTTPKPHKTHSSRRPAPAKKPASTTTTTASGSQSTRKPADSVASSSTTANATTATTLPARKPVIQTSSSSSSTTSSTSTTTTVFKDELIRNRTTTRLPERTTQAPRPKPKPTGEIVKVPALLAEPTTTTGTTAGSSSSSPSKTPASSTTPLVTKKKPNTTTAAPTSTTTTTTTTPKPTRRSTTKAPTTTTTKATTTTTKATTTSTTSTTTTTTAKPLLTTEAPTVAPLTTTTKKTGLITWTDVEAEPPTNASISNDWQPAPPSNWVPLATQTPEAANQTSASTAPPSATDKVVISVATSVSEVETHGPGKPHKTTKPSKPSKPSSTAKPTTTKTTTAATTTVKTTEAPASSIELASSTSSYTDLSSEVAASSSSSSSSSSTTSTTTSSPTTTAETTDYSGEEPNTTTIEATGSTTVAPANALEGVDYKEVCGRRMFPEPRIVGGANAAFGRWPWQISLRQWRTSTYLHKCGAALLNENWAITAAHCVDNVPPSDLLLRLGEYDLAEEEEPYGYQERRVQIVASHPQFDPRTFEYDLALLRFYEPVVFQPNIIPVCVPDNDENFIGQTAFVTGWGRLYEDGPLPSVLQEVAVPVINNTICESMYRSAGYIEHIPHIFICAGWKKGGYDSCEGDSGGPMVLQREADKRFQLGGVISWGIGCAEANQPGVYTRISEFRDWINQILQF